MARQQFDRFAAVLCATNRKAARDRLSVSARRRSQVADGKLMAKARRQGIYRARRIMAPRGIRNQLALAIENRNVDPGFLLVSSAEN